MILRRDLVSFITKYFHDLDDIDDLVCSLYYSCLCLSERMVVVAVGSGRP